MTSKRTTRIVIVSTLLALMVSMFLVLTASAQAVSPAHEVSHMSVNGPNAGIPTSKIVTDQHGLAVFKPTQLTCRFQQQKACIRIGNFIRGTNIRIFIDGLEIGHIPYGLYVFVVVSSPGIHLVTIPDNNPQAKLTVIAQ